MGVVLTKTDMIVSIIKGNVTRAPVAITYTYTDDVKPQSRPRPQDLLKSLTARERFRESFVLSKPGISPRSGGFNFYYLDTVMGSNLRAWFPLKSSDACDMKMLGRIKDQKVNLAVMLPELGKTTDLLTDGLRDMISVLRHLKRGNLVAALKAVRGPTNPVDKQLAKRFLEYSYGYLPLASDIFGLTLELERALEAGLDIRGACRTDISRSLSYDYYGKVDLNCNGYRRNSWVYTVDSKGVKTASALGLTNPLAVVWELVPYSFVLDWFVGVGDWISCLDAGVGVRSFHCSRSIRVEASGTAEAVRAPARPLSAVHCSYYKRTTTRTLPTPTLTFNSPGLRNLALALSLLRIQR